MSTLTLEHEPLASNVIICGEKLGVELVDGRSLSVPLEWYPRLVGATESERTNWHLLGDGCAIEWPDLDEHIGVASLLAGRGSGECSASFQRWRLQGETAEQQKEEERVRNRLLPLSVDRGVDSNPVRWIVFWVQTAQRLQITVKRSLTRP